jgi:2-polyprenyl-3-methyl-5-hydroxy-6-metoxy-1,4-benzoquinol methylase
MKDNKLTKIQYWENIYHNNDLNTTLIDIDDYRELPFRRTVDLIGGIGLDGMKVLEIGAGNSSLLLSLAKINAHKASFSGLDYSEIGCKLLRNRAKLHGLTIDVIHADMFNPRDELIGKYDLLYSIGVVEHFAGLRQVIRSMKKFLKTGGIIITLIPNMRGAIGYLTKTLNRQVYDLHNPHDLTSLVEGHEDEEMKVLKYNYLCSNNFGVISSCFNKKHGLGWKTYVLLSRISKLTWKIEYKYGDFPHTKLLSPYLYVVAKK